MSQQSSKLVNLVMNVKEQICSVPVFMSYLKRMLRLPLSVVYHVQIFNFRIINLNVVNILIPWLWWLVQFDLKSLFSRTVVITVVLFTILVIKFRGFIDNKIFVVPSCHADAFLT